MSTDFELLTRYRAGSGAAFAELAGRHVGWVYSAARRRVGDDHLAADVTQTVFATLAGDRRAGGGAGVANWLFGVMRHAAARAVRDRARRRRHEAAAAVGVRAAADPDPAWAELAPLLDDAVDRLRAADRRAVLLRFYQQQSFADVGAALGVSEDGARKRVGRAVSQLRRYFADRGVTTPDGAVPGLLFQHCVGAAPAGLAAAVGRPPGPVPRRPGWPAVGAAAAAAGMVAVTWAAWRATAPPPAPARPVVATRPSPGADPATRPTGLTFDRIVAAVARTERQFTNVHVRDFETTVSERKGEGPWTATPIRYAGSAWYGPDPRGPQRVYFTTHVMRWENGAAPVIDQMLDLSGDGQSGLEMRLATQSGNRAWLRLRTAMISTGLPMAQGGTDTLLATGAGLTLQYGIGPMDVSGARDPVGPRRPLSDNLRFFRADPRVQVDVAAERVNGVDAVRLRLNWGSHGSDAWWFDPARGYAMVKLEQVASQSGVSWTDGIDVSALAPAGPDLWFPVRATAVIHGGGSSGNDVRYDYRAEEVTANDPAFDPAVFRPAVPIGWRVDDDRQQPRRSYVTMPGGTELEIHTGSAMPRVRAAEDRRPDEPGPAITRDPRAWW